MTDWPATTIAYPVGSNIHVESQQAATYGAGVLQVANYAAAAWPAANRAIYVPFNMDWFAKARVMFWENGGVNGTTDVGIYDAITLKRLVSLTATTNAGTVQIGNIADTDLNPGCYYMGMTVSTVTTETVFSIAASIPFLRACGVVQQALGSAALPDPMVPAAVATAYLPFFGVSFQATM